MPRVTKIGPFSNLQTLNVALATGFVVTCGDAVQAISDKWNPGSGLGLRHVVLLALLVSIGAKVAFDDHLALYRGKIRPFQALDSTFLVVAYSTLISAAALIAEFWLSALLLAGYLLILWAWNAVIIAIELFGRRPPYDEDGSGIRWWFGSLSVDVRWIWRPVIWFFLDLVFGGFIAWFAWGEQAEIVLGLGAAFLILDILLSRTFSR